MTPKKTVPAPYIPIAIEIQLGRKEKQINLAALLTPKLEVAS
jgi:hypothetical protein